MVQSISDLKPSGPDPDALRDKGNGLYKAGKLKQAIECYLEASGAAPEDSRPLGNLSACYFELGQYASSMEYAEKSIRLSASDPKRAEKLIEALRNLPAASVDRKLLANCDASQGSQISDVHIKKYWLNIIHHLPRNLPFMHEEYMHMNFGHDFGHWQLDAAVFQNDPDEPISVLFGGIGDARHLLTTLIVPELLIRNWYPALGITAKDEPEWLTSMYRHRQLNFTCSDVKPAVIARLFLVLSIMGALGDMAESTKLDSDDEGNAESTEMFTCLLLYLSIGAIMPRCVYEQFQQTLASAISMLEGTSDQRHSWLYVYDIDAPALLKVLRGWQKPAPEKWSTAKVRRKSTGRKWSEMNILIWPAMKDESILWEKTGIIIPPPRILKRHEPLIHSLVQDLAKTIKSKEVIAELVEHVDNEWFPNLTIVDPQDLDETRHAKTDVFNWHPYDILPHRFQKNDGPARDGKRLYDWALVTFGRYAQIIYEFRANLTIELTVADVFQQMEQMHHIGFFTHRSSNDLMKKDLSKLSLRYDQIHLSNIPDYIGGPLPAIMYGTRVTRTDWETSHVTFNIMSEKGAYGTYERERFLNNYFKQHVGAPPDDRSLTALLNAATVEKPKQPWMEMYDYLAYHYWRRNDDPTVSRGQLYKQSELEDWFYKLFFDIILPCKRDPGGQNPKLIMQTLNMTFVFRLMVHLHEIGYPSHWLAQILTTLLSGHITTTARPPKSYPCTSQQEPLRRISILPFAQELRTLASMFAPALPFGFPTTQALPPADDIVRLSLSWEEDKVPIMWAPDMCAHYFLLLVDTYKAQTENLSFKNNDNSFRDILVDDETSAHVSKHAKLRDEGLVVVTTFKFEDLKGDKAGGVSFWFEKERMQKMFNDGDWAVHLMRNDYWGVFAYAHLDPRRVEIIDCWDELETR